jgi:Ca2+-binding EF-hand superfamily protein
MVKKAFSILDRNSSGTITISDIDGIYDVSMNPEFLEGRKTKDEIYTEFLSNFEGSRGNGDGCVTW